jgi:hypothetical protein
MWLEARSILVAMPWTCPACSTDIRHAASETAPSLKTVYRCHVCRLELVVDRHTYKMIVVPIERGPYDTDRLTKHTPR